MVFDDDNFRTLVRLGTDLALYKSILRDPQCWLNTAQALRKTALRVEPNENDIKSSLLHEQWTMLLHFSLENVLKGLTVARNPAIADETDQSGELPEKLKTHSLLTLVDRLGLSVKSQKKDVLAYIQYIGESGGRYPCAADVSKHSTVRSADFLQIRKVFDEVYRLAGGALIREIWKKPTTTARLHKGQEFPVEIWIEALLFDASFPNDSSPPSPQ